MIKLGSTYRDQITGFEGVATGYVEYLSGCNQVLLVPRVGRDGAMRDSQWFDVQRVKLDDVALPITLDNGQTPGFDKGRAETLMKWPRVLPSWMYCPSNVEFVQPITGAQLEAPVVIPVAKSGDGPKDRYYTIARCARIRWLMKLH